MKTLWARFLFRHFSSRMSQRGLRSSDHWVAAVPVTQREGTPGVSFTYLQRVRGRGAGKEGSLQGCSWSF